MGKWLVSCVHALLIVLIVLNVSAVYWSRAHRTILWITSTTSDHVRPRQMFIFSLFQTFVYLLHEKYNNVKNWLTKAVIDSLDEGGLSRRCFPHAHLFSVSIASSHDSFLKCCWGFASRFFFFFFFFYCHIFREQNIVCLWEGVCLDLNMYAATTLGLLAGSRQVLVIERHTGGICYCFF